MRRLILLLLVIVLVVILSLNTGCQKGKVSGMNIGTNNKPVKVKVLEIHKENFSIPVYFTGKVIPKEKVLISPEVGGRVVKIYKDKGQNVKKGDKLLKIDSRELEIALMEAEANLRFQESNYKKYKRLYEKKAVSSQQFLKTETMYKSALSRYESLKLKIEKTLITSPIDGIIVDRYISLSELAVPGKPVFKIENQNPVKIKLELSEQDLIYVRKDEVVEVEFSIPELSKRKGRIDYISNSADPISSKFIVEVLVDNPDGKIRTGFLARVRFNKEVLKGVYIVPQNSLIIDNENYFLYKVDENNRAHLIKVKLNDLYEDKAIIESGIKDGDRIVILGAKLLKEGSIVKIENG